VRTSLLSAIMCQSSSYSVSYIGDSTTEWGFLPRFAADGFAGIISDAEGVAGEGTVTLYDDQTLQWEAAGDTSGARIAFEYGRKCWYESGSPKRGVSIIVPPEFSAYASLEGTPIPLTMLANNGMGGRDQAPFVLGQILNGQRFDVLGIHGMAGQRAEQILLRIADSWEKDTFGRPLAIKPTHIVVLVGINDVSYINGGSAPYGVEEVKDWLDDIRDAILAQGIMPIFGNLVEESPSPSKILLIDELNLHIAGMGVPFVDYHAACNGVAGAMSGSHYTTLGAKLSGAVLANLFESIAGQGNSRFGVSTSTTNRIVNGSMSGTAGTLTGMTGVAAVDSTFVGTGTCVASKQLISGDNYWQVYTVTGAADGDTITTEFDPSWTIGQDICGSVNCDITGDGVSNANFTIEFRSAGDTRIESFYSLAEVSNNDAGELAGILQTPIIEVPTYYNTGRAYASVILSAGDTVVKFRNAGVRSI